MVSLRNDTGLTGRQKMLEGLYRAFEQIVELEHTSIRIH